MESSGGQSPTGSTAGPDDDPPSPADLSVVTSAPVPGGAHLLMSADAPGDASLHQFFLGEDGQPPDRLAELFAAALTEGTALGAGQLRGVVPQGLRGRGKSVTDHHTEIALVDADGTERYILTLYRRTWPQDTSGPEMLSDLVGEHAPELVGRIETQVNGRRYTLGTVRRSPAGDSALDLTVARVAARYFSHSDSFEIGRTIRYVHDSLLMAFPHRWVPAGDIARKLEERLDGFVTRDPALAGHAGWIREAYRSLSGEMLVQRIHGNLTAEHIWLEDDHWVIGGWEGDVRLPRGERIPMGSPLYDLAALQGSLYIIARAEPPWHVKAMRSLCQGYGEPLNTLPMNLFTLDTACNLVADPATPADYRDTILGSVLESFRTRVMPVGDRMEPSAFHRPV